MDIILCDAASGDKWNAFVEHAQDGWHYHLFGWKRVIESAYGHECPYLMAVRGEAVLGVLPLVIVKSRWFGRSATSLPYVDTAGVLAESPEVCTALVEHATSVARQHDVSYLELRQASELKGTFRVDTHKVSLTLPVKATVEEQWAAVPAERRNRIRKARKSELQVDWAGRGALRPFYDVWCRNMRDLGSPVHSMAWFDAVLKEFSDSSGIELVRWDQTFVGGAVWLRFKNVLAVPWVSSLRQHFDKHPNDILYWGAIESAIENHCHTFDFGRSTKPSGNYTYKARWGADERPLYWHYRSVGEGEPELPSDDRVKYRWAARIWRRMPLGVTNLIGPCLRKGITN